MADNWSSSVVTLTDAGDWAKWTITLGSTNAANLNDTVGPTILHYFALRYAMSAASRTGFFALVINDVVGEGIVFTPPLAIVSSGGWTSAGRFRGGPAGIGSFGAFAFPLDTVNESNFGISSAAFTSGPWVAGTNTVRLLWLGRASDGAAEPVEIDFLAIQTGSGSTIVDDWGNFGSDGTVAGTDLKPVTGTPVGYTGYDDLVDGNKIQSTGKLTWLLKGDEPSTGTAADSILEVIKFCPAGGDVEAKIRVTGAGDPVAGTVGVLAAGTATLATLDGAGEATFTIPAGEDADFWYGGTDDWAPAAVSIDSTDRIGCHGWHVGYIAMAS